MDKKNKISTFILLLLVVAIWGAVVYRIYEARHGSIVAPPFSLNSITENADSTIVLNLKYRDPFLGTQIIPSKTPVKKVGKLQPMQPKSNVVSYQSMLSNVRRGITFNGLIANRTKSGYMGIVQTNGEVRYIKLNSSIDSLIVTYIGKDSIVLKGSHTYSIRKIQ